MTETVPNDGRGGWFDLGPQAVRFQPNPRGLYDVHGKVTNRKVKQYRARGRIAEAALESLGY